jgi:hypothetical protein
LVSRIFFAMVLPSAPVGAILPPCMMAIAAGLWFANLFWLSFS